MAVTADQQGAAGAPAQYHLDEWLVQPSLNRVSSDRATIQLEPKVMDVLTLLARRAGQVVSKDELIDEVWQRKYISEWVITRAIAKLRSALGDDAQRPRFIETISKRGYRLIVTPVFPSRAEAAPGVPHPSVAVPTIATAEAYGLGQWVRGPHFLGREQQIAEILDGPRNWIWLLGTRGIGKTSLLKHIEHLTTAQPQRGFFPLFWDLQGAAEPDELHRDFGEALLETESRLSPLGIDVGEVADENLFVSLGKLRRRLAANEMRLLLLCDEVEELIQLRAQDLALLRKLRRALQSREAIRSVLAASGKLWVLEDQREDTSPFLHGFTPPLYLGALTDESARRLIERSLEGEGFGAAVPADVAETIARTCGNHPYLVQLLCSRFVERGDLGAAIEEVAVDRGVAFLFSVDHETLGPEEREALAALAGEGAKVVESISADVGGEAAARGALYRLEQMGLVRCEEGRYRVSSTFLSKWLQAALFDQRGGGGEPGVSA